MQSLSLPRALVVYGSHFLAMLSPLMAMERCSVKAYEEAGALKEAFEGKVAQERPATSLARTRACLSEGNGLGRANGFLVTQV